MISTEPNFVRQTVGCPDWACTTKKIFFKLHLLLEPSYKIVPRSLARPGGGTIGGNVASG